MLWARFRSGSGSGSLENVMDPYPAKWADLLDPDPQHCPSVPHPNFRVALVRAVFCQAVLQFCRFCA